MLRCLTEGASLSALPLGRHEGRVDLRGFRSLSQEPETSPVVYIADADSPSAPALSVRRVGTTEVGDASLEGVDFSGAHLVSFRFFDTVLRDCRFNGACCQDWRVWHLTVSDCSFENADLRESSLGPWHGGRVSRWERVTFAHADLREAIPSAARFVDCDFSHARMRHVWNDEGFEMFRSVDFGGSHLVRCRFAGFLEGVVFRDLPTHWSGSEEPPAHPEPNPMEDVDFTAASLCFVEFRGLKLDRVRLPEDDDHVIVAGGLATVRRAQELFKESGVQIAGLEVTLESALRWWHPERKIGIWHRLEFGEEAQRQAFAIEILRAAERDVLTDAA